MAKEELDDDNDRRNARIISIVLGIFTLGIVHGMCALVEWCITPSAGDSAQEKTKNIADSRLPKKDPEATYAKEENDENVKDGWGTIPEEIVLSLNTFLPDVQNLSMLADRVPSSKSDAKPEFRFLRGLDMPHNLMRGEFENGRPFIVAKVSCELTDENIAKICNGYDEEEVERIKKNRHQNHFIFLYQEWPRDTKLMTHALGCRAKFLWQECPFSSSFSPRFFDGAFMHSSTGVINEREKEHAVNLGKLFKGEEAHVTDLNGLSWHLFA